jgi:hypothetical protein
MRLNPRIARLIENVLVAAITAVVILVWEPTRDRRHGMA